MQGKNKRLVTIEDFESAKDKVMMGAERRSMVMSQKKKKNLLHIMKQVMLLQLFTHPASDPIHKATIIPRGRALRDGYEACLKKINFL